MAFSKLNFQDAWREKQEVMTVGNSFAPVLPFMPANMNTIITKC